VGLAGGGGFEFGGKLFECGFDGAGLGGIILALTLPDGFTAFAPTRPGQRREHIHRELQQPTTELIYLRNVHGGLTRDFTKGDKALLADVPGIDALGG